MWGMSEVLEVSELLEYQGLEALDASRAKSYQAKKENVSGDRLKADSGKASSSAKYL